MDKVRNIFIFFFFTYAFFSFFKVGTAYANIPTCNLSEVNIYAYPTNDSWEAKPPACLPLGTTDNDRARLPFSGPINQCGPSDKPCGDKQIYCISPVGIGIAIIDKGIAGCFEKGKTQQVPNCPTGTVRLSGCGGSACSGLSIANPICVAESTCSEQGLSSPNQQACQQIIVAVKDKTYELTENCGPLFRYDSSSKMCVGAAATPWQRTSTCDNGTVGIQTAIGCVPTGSLPDTLSFVLKFALAAAAGVIVLLLIATGYGLLTSQGNPEKLAAAKENIVSILSGLILIVFSLVLLQTIGANILGLPSF